MEESLKRKVIKGFSWNLVERIGINIIKFIIGIILARLLLPKDFGLIGIITVFFAVAEILIQGGFMQAYVQKKSVTDMDSSTVFYTNLSISLFLYSVLWLVAPFIAKFYKQDLLVSLIRVMGSVLIINSLSVIQIAKLTRNIYFKHRARITVISSLVSGVLGVISALKGLGVWSLVIQQLGNRFLIAVGLWSTSSWKPKLQFSTSSFSEMFSFGGWLLISALLKRIFENIYYLMIGKFFSPAWVGFYQKSKQFSDITSQQIARVIGDVSFPVFAKLKEDNEKIVHGVRKFLEVSLMVITPLSIILFVIAEPFVILLLTEKWSPMIPLVKVLSIIGLVLPFRVINYQLLLAQGKGRIGFTISMITNLSRLANFIITFRFGIIYILYGELVINVLAYLLNARFINEINNYGFIKQFKDVWRTLLSGAVAAVSGTLMIYSINTDLVIIVFICAIIIITTYIAMQYFINRTQMLYMSKIIINIVSKKTL